MCGDEHSINVVSPGMATVCLVLNIFFPGLGTIINGLSGHKVCPGVLFGFLQFFLTPLFLVGWIWGIVYGVRIVGVANKHHDGYHGHHDGHHDHHDHHHDHGHGHHHH